MGGAVYRGYAPGSKPEPEWNIKSNAAAARTVFTAGVPLLVAPLDSTADLKLTPDLRVTIFARGTPFNDALAALNQIWRHTNHWKGETRRCSTCWRSTSWNPASRTSSRSCALEVADDGLTHPGSAGKQTPTSHSKSTCGRS